MVGQSDASLSPIIKSIKILFQIFGQRGRTAKYHFMLKLNALKPFQQ